MKLIRKDDGQMLVLVALSMAVLLGFLAFAVDVGLLFRSQRNMQIAADAAAVAGALDYKYNASVTSAQAAGQAAATANGVTNGANGATVAVNCPPTSGPNAGSACVGFVEAIVTQPNNTFFMQMFGSNAVSVNARAVAGAGVTQGCIWALGRTGIDIPISGSGSINAPNCDIYDDSSANNALDLTGSGSLTAQEIGIVGSYQDTGSGRIHPTPTTGMAPAASPITVSSPNIPTATATAPTGSGSAFTCAGTSNCTIGPGTYSSITNSGTGTLTFSAGTYNVTGNIQNTGSGQIASNSGAYTFDVGGNVTNSGGAMVLGAGTYNVVGNVKDSGSGILTFGGNSVINGSVTAASSGTVTLDAGDYIINGCLCDTGSGNMTTGAGNYTMGTFTSSGSSSLTLGSGLYETTGNQSLTGSGALSGSSVTFFTEGSTTVSGSGSMNLTAPTSGTYDGIVFFEPTTGNQPISVTGSGGMTLEGIFYAPSATVTFSGSGSGTVYTDFIVDAIDFTGSASFNSYQTINSSALLGKIALVE